MLIGISLIIALVRWRQSQAWVTYVIPTPVMPSPNAFDVFEKADKAILADEEVELSFGTDAKPVPFDRAKVIVEKNGEALKLVRNGLEMPYMEPPCRSFRTLLPYLSKHRHIARLMRFTGDTLAKEGKTANAVDTYIDAIRFGREQRNGAMLLSALVAYACENIANGGIPACVDNLNAADARRLARKLESADSDCVPISESYRYEMWVGLSVLEEIHHDPQIYMEEFLEIKKGSEDPLVNRMRVLRVDFTLPAGQREYLAIMNQLIAEGDKPLCRAKLPPNPKTFIAEAVVPAGGTAICRCAEVRARTQMAILALALRAYRVEHDAYPEKLDALAPDYLTRLPDDPFAPSGTYRYRRDGDGYLLYSVGPDGVDDGGKLITDPTDPTSVAKWPKPGCKGDFVYDMWDKPLPKGTLSPGTSGNGSTKP